MAVAPDPRETVGGNPKIVQVAVEAVGASEKENFALKRRRLGAETWGEGSFRKPRPPALPVGGFPNIVEQPAVFALPAHQKQLTLVLEQLVEMPWSKRALENLLLLAATREKKNKKNKKIFFKEHASG